MYANLYINFHIVCIGTYIVYIRQRVCAYNNIYTFWGAAYTRGSGSDELGRGDGDAKRKKRKVFATKNALCLVARKSPRARTESRIFIWTSHRRRRT